MKKLQLLNILSLVCILSFTSISYAEADTTTDATTNKTKKVETQIPTKKETAASAVLNGKAKKRVAAKDGATEVVISATRIETPTRQIASSVTVISSKEIEQKQNTSVIDLLQSVPGISIARNGSFGQTSSVFIRGTNSSHVLVLVDGIEMNDPSGPSRGYDFANLLADNVAQIEVVRGPQSTLYGSDAIGGVINIITKKGKGPMTGYASFEAGSYGTYQEKVGVSGGDKLFNYSFGVTRLDSKGISAASESLGNLENDGYENTTISTRLGVTPTEKFELNFILRWIDSNVDIDNRGGAGGDDINYGSTSEQLFFRTYATLSLLDDLWQQTFGVSLSKHKRRLRNDTDPAHPLDSSLGTFDGQVVKVDWQHNLYFSENNTFTFGVEYEQEEMSSSFQSTSAFGPFSSTFAKKTAQTVSYFLQDQIKLWDALFITAGVRFDDHDAFGTEVTYHGSIAYLIHKTNTKLKATYGTGFKAPSLFQLYSSFGNLNLLAEESVGWDAGFEQELFNKKVVFGATFYHNNLDNLIDFSSVTFTYGNIAKAQMQGVEVFLTWFIAKDLTFRVGYTYTDTQDKVTNLDLLRRAKNKFTFDANYNFLEKGNINLSIVDVSDSDDAFFDTTTFTTKRVTLASYVLVNLAVSYDVTSHLKLFGRLENLLNEKYEQVRGYGTRGTSIFAGAKLTF